EPGTWHHVVLTWRVLDLAVSVDGVRKEAAPIASSKGVPHGLDLDGAWSDGLAPGSAPGSTTRVRAPDEWLPDAGAALVVGGFSVGGRAPRWCDATIADVHWRARFLPREQDRALAAFGSTFETSAWSTADA